MKPLYSVVIPIYNAEQTLRRCLDSILNQEHGNVEILMIDDGSSDSSGMICREYSEKDYAFRYYRKENGGVSSARNAGLQHAEGEYILFVDSDDHVTPDCFSLLDEIISDDHYDYIQMSTYYSKNGQIEKKQAEPFSSMEREAIFPVLMEKFHHKEINGPCEKLYKRELIQRGSIQFPEFIEVGEDRSFNLHYSFYINSMFVSDKPIYCVVLDNTESLSRKIREDLDVQTERIRRYVETLIESSSLPEVEKIEYRKALNYDVLRAVYTKAKYYHRKKLPLLTRLKAIKKDCDVVNEHGWEYPQSRYCRLTVFPVEKKMTLLLDAMAWKLTH